MTDDEETYTAIYAVADLSVRTALLRVFGHLRNENTELRDAIDLLNADAKTQQLAISFGRWAGPMIVGLVIAIVSLVFK